MGKNWGRTPVTNADKRGATMIKYLVEVDGGTEERIDRRPLGKVERFVDPDGGVVSLQLFSDGDPQRHATEIRKRAELHRRGFVDHGKCPYKHGTRNASPLASKDFAAIEKLKDAPPIGECKQDPAVMKRLDGDLYAGHACPHIEALIKFRRDKAAKAYEKRNALAVAKDRRDQERRELEAMQLEKTREELAERRQRKPAKPKEIVE